MTNAILRRQIQRTLYSLKREYGERIDVYRLVSSTVDRSTGRPTTVKEVFNLRQAIFLPESLSLFEKRGISLISANKELVQGGHWEVGTRLLLIDRADLSDVELTTDDWAVHDGRKYEFATVQDYAGCAWIIKTRAVTGDTPQQIQNLWAGSHVNVENTSGQTP